MPLDLAPPAAAERPPLALPGGADAELLSLSLAELQQRFRDGRLSPLELTEAVLAAARARQPLLGAFALLDEDGARAAARAATERHARGVARGPLDGIPLGVKDLIDVRGLPTRQGSLSTADAPPAAEDAPAVARLREAGAVLLGKTATHEFGLGSQPIPHTGWTRNPWSPGHRTGGSSAGAVAAVAAGLGPVGLGTDGGGSIREPAAWSGLVGFKPSYGWVAAQTPWLAGMPPLVGPLAHSVADARAVFEVIAAPDRRDPYALPAAWRARVDRAPEPQTLRLAAAVDFNGQRPTPAVEAAFEAALAVFARWGVRIERRTPPAAPASLARLSAARAALTVSALSITQRARLDPVVRELAARGEALSARELAQAEAERAAYTAALADFFADTPLLLTPTSPRGAPRLDDAAIRQAGGYVAPFSWSRQPAISLPAGREEAGLPLGVQLVGRLHEDGLLLAVAEAWEARAEHLADFRRAAAALRRGT